MEVKVNVYYLLGVSIPVIGFVLMLLLAIKNMSWSVKSFMSITFIGFIASLTGLFVDTSSSLKIAYLLSSLILFVSLNVQKFSLSYMQGDRKYGAYFIKLAGLTVSSHLMVFSQLDSLFWIFWSLNGLLLASLMTHKSQWMAAKYSGIYTAGILTLGSIFLAVAFIFPQYAFAPWCLVLAAMCQSAIWPFHRWLLSSLNSPTPVSALMHAGIVNGGGILLVKYHHVISNDSALMYFIFGMGLVTALLGGFWKLIQVDIKKMLANSTMAQMGFMFMQCGMGLFPAAVAHLCWHGLFKAYLFLNSGSAVQAKFECEHISCDFKHYVGVFISTMLALGLFIYSADIDLSVLNTRWILIGMVFITLWQLSKGLVGKNHLFLDMALVSVFSGVYGVSLRMIESCFTDAFTLPQALNPLYLLGFGLLAIIWIFKNSEWFLRIKQSQFGQRAYVWALNASQPYTKTFTSFRQTYRF
jgi:NAD(P)H-quinone oxidoreductase subunit 5